MKFQPIEASAVRVLLLKEMQVLNAGIASHRKEKRSFALAILQSAFDRCSVIETKLQHMTCTDHAWKTDSTGLVDECERCGECRA